jgi:hypothetical protein
MSSHVATLLAETAATALPAGVFNLVPGSGPAVGEALMRAPEVSAISFTGSGRVGARVAAIAAERNIRYQTEMGGKNIAIVLPDADIAQAASLTAAGAMRYAGQKCTATSRVVVAHDIEGPFLAELRRQIDALVLGPVTAPNAAVGPVISEHARDSIRRALDASDAERVYEGTVPDSQALTPDADPGTTDDGNPATYDDELLDAHFIAGDGRANENIALTAVHHVFHSEHNRLNGDVKALIDIDPRAEFQAEWHLADASWNGERIFQAAKFVTEMEYQHLVFEEFARKMAPGINVFGEGGFLAHHPDIDPTILAEFAHAAFRLGHSMLPETVARTNADGSDNSAGLISVFLNPPAFLDGGSAGPLNFDQAAGAIVRGLTRQAGNELDEFVTEAVRNNLLGLPLDLAAINIARGRDTGIPPLNGLRRQIFAKASASPAMEPYSSWVDYGFSLRNPESLVNFVAAYGTHPSVTGASGLAAKRAAAGLLVGCNLLVMSFAAEAAGIAPAHIVERVLVAARRLRT